MEYDRLIQRILPIPDAAVRVAWTQEEVTDEAERRCKPFCCVVQGCLEPKIRNEAQKARCAQAPMNLSRCIAEVSAHMQEIQERKRTALGKR